MLTDNDKAYIEARIDALNVRGTELAVIIGEEIALALLSKRTYPKPRPPRRGTWVIVRCYGGKASRLRVWDEDGDTVQVQADAQYRRNVENLICLPPVAFPRKDVFWDDTFDPNPPAEYWDTLKPFEDERG